MEEVENHMDQDSLKEIRQDYSTLRVCIVADQVAYIIFWSSVYSLANKSLWL